MNLYKNEQFCEAYDELSDILETYCDSPATLEVIWGKTEYENGISPQDVIQFVKEYDKRIMDCPTFLDFMEEMDELDCWVVCDIIRECENGDYQSMLITEFVEQVVIPQYEDTIEFWRDWEGMDSEEVVKQYLKYDECYINGDTVTYRVN